LCFLLFLGFSGVFPPSPRSPVLVSSLYTSCMLRDAIYAFYKIIYLSKKKKKSIEWRNLSTQEEYKRNRLFFLISNKLVLLKALGALKYTGSIQEKEFS
jgi:hypothetical protein